MWAMKLIAKALSRGSRIGSVSRLPPRRFAPIRLPVTDPFITLENGKRVPLSPGMTVMAEVKTGTRKPIEYVLAPLKKYGAESGWER